jgi:hypothetical protein
MMKKVFKTLWVSHLTNLSLYIDKPLSQRVLTINFQSIKNKKPELDQIIESCQPTIMFGSETWLSDNISPYEYFDPTKYTVSINRKDATK